ncbi:MAG: hypothetical protein QW065_01395 [Acidilobaceae archaeon]
MSYSLIKLASLYSGLHEYKSVKSYIEKFEHIIKEAGLEDYYIGSLSTRKEPLRVKNAMVFIATGGTSSLGFDLFSESERVYLIYHEEHNSLASALNLASMLKSENKFVKLYSLGEFEKVASTLRRSISGLNKVYGSKILVVGSLPLRLIKKGLVNAIRSHFGIELEVLGLDSVYKELPNADPRESEVKATELLAGAESSEISYHDLLTSVSIYLAIRRVVETKSAKVVAIGCFDLLKDLNNTGCIAVAELIREGVIASCEADVSSSIVMKLLKEISGLDPWIGNVSGLQEDEVELSHCVVSRSVVKSYRLTTHFEPGKATSIEGVVEEGLPATIVSYDPLRSLWRVIEARVSRRSFSGKKCRTQVRFHVSPQAIKEIREDPIEGHYVVVFSNVVDEVSLAGELAGLNVQLFRLS